MLCLLLHSVIFYFFTVGKYEFHVTVKFQLNAATTNKTHIFIYFLDVFLFLCGAYTQTHTERVSMVCVMTTTTTMMTMTTIWMSCVNLLLPRELLSQNAIVSNRLCVRVFVYVIFSHFDSHASSLSSVRTTFASKTIFLSLEIQPNNLPVCVIHCTCNQSNRELKRNANEKKCLEFGLVSFLSLYNSNDNKK